MPTFYNYRENGVTYSFDDVFVPADAFRQGNLWTWGGRVTVTLGGLGDNTTVTRSTPVTTFAGGANWKQVSCGYFNMSSVKTDGTLWVWGDNSLLQLGVLDGFVRCTPVTTFAGGTNWKQVSSSYRTTAAIKTDGTLWTWGWNGYGQLGDNTTIRRSSPVTTFAGGTNWKQVHVGGTTINFITAIKTDGTLWTWGSNSYGQLGNNTSGSNRLTPVTTFAGGTNWKQVQGGGYFTTAIKTDGTLWTWGRNNFGQLGNNALLSNRLTPVTTFAGGTNWKQVCAGLVHVAAVKNDGTLWTWGISSPGSLGNNDAGVDRPTPITTFAGGTNWKQVDAGRLHTVAVKTDGTLWTFGSNGFGQLGENTITNKLTPVTTFLGGTSWKQASAGGYQSAATTYIDDYL